MFTICSARQGLALAAAGAVAVLVASCATDVVSPGLRAVPGAALNAAGSDCPAGYTLESAKVGDPRDVNGDGLFCVGPAGDVVDNDVIDHGNGAGKVTGHANFSERTKEGSGDLSFSFHAIVTGGKSQAAKGEFDFHDLGRGFHVHGDVVCAVISDNTAQIGGVVTQSDDATLREGTPVYWAAIDRGEPGDLVDEVSRPFEGVRSKEEEKSKSNCVLRLPRTQRVLSGNIQVH